MSGKRKAPSPGPDESGSLNEPTTSKQDFWTDLNWEMKKKIPSLLSAEEGPDTFLAHFQNRVPLPTEVRADFPTLCSATTAAVAATTTLPDHHQALFPASSSSASATTATSSSAAAAASQPDWDRVEALIETDESIPDATLEDYVAAIEKISHHLETPQSSWPFGFLWNKKRKKYKDRLRFIEICREKEAKLRTDRKKLEVERKDERKKLEVERKEREVERVMSWVDRTAAKKDNIILILQALANLSTETKKTFAKNTYAADIEKKKRKYVYERPKADQVVSQLDPNGARNKLVDEVSKFEEFGRLAFESVVTEGETNVTDNLYAVAKIYETLFRHACFLRREDDRDGNAEFYKKLMQPAVAFLEKAATNIREGTMQSSVKTLIKDIKSQNMDQDLVKVVERLQELRSSREQYIIPIESTHPKYQGIFDSINNHKDKNDAVKVINKHLDELMPSLMWLPGPTAQEVHGSQVVFRALLEAIAECLPKSAPASGIPSEAHAGALHGLQSIRALCKSDSAGNRKTPLKGLNKEERNHAETDYRPPRFADFTLAKRGQYRVCLHDDIFEVFIEIKPYQRLVSGANKCQNEALNQGLSHAGKALHCAVELGPGFPGHAIFIVGSVLNVTVYKLVLVDPGTPDAKLKLEVSEHLPLLPRECYDRYVGSDKRHGDEDECFRSKLYPRKSGDMGQTGIPALAKVMRSSWGTLIRLDHPSLQYASLLGYGSFGLVLDVGGKVAKLSRYGNYHDLQNEVAILKYLEKQKEKIIHDGATRVVSIESHGIFEIPYRGIRVELPGLVLSPKGNRLHTLEANALKQVASDLLCGLDWLHDKGIAHNDISDTNFVLVHDRAVITDFAFAKPLSTVIHSYVGTPDFSHSDVHSGNSGYWIARAEYDIAALAYVLCTLSNDGKTPWSPIAQPCKNKEDPKLVDRNNNSIKWLDHAMLDDGNRLRLRSCVKYSKPVKKCTGYHCAKEDCARCQCSDCTDACPCRGKCKKGCRPKFQIDSREIDFKNSLSLERYLDENNYVRMVEACDELKAI